jgi:hypothetical protein
MMNTYSEGIRNAVIKPEVVVHAFRRLRQEGPQVGGQLGLHSETVSKIQCDYYTHMGLVQVFLPPFLWNSFYPLL